MEKKCRYVVIPVSNYSEQYFRNKRKAIRYARSITDSTNSSAKVLDIWKNSYIAGYGYTPNGGGETFKMVV